MATPTNKTTHVRQWPLVLEQPFDFNDMLTANLSGTVTLLQPRLPANAVVLSTSVHIDVAFDAGAAMGVGVAANAISGAGANATLFHTAVAMDAVATTTIATGAVGLGLHAAGDTITMTPDAQAVAATVGSGRLVFTYIIAGRGTEVQA